MKLKFATLAAASLLALVSCGGAKAISYEAYRAKVEALTPAAYAKATVKYSRDVNGEKANGSIDYTFADGVWSTTSNDAYAEPLSNYVGMTANEMTAEAADPESLPEGSSVTFYDDLSYSSKISMKQSLPVGDLFTVTMTVKISGSAKFESTGVLTSMSQSQEETVSGIPAEYAEFMKQQGIENGTSKGKTSFTISYSK